MLTQTVSDLWVILQWFSNFFEESLDCLWKMVPLKVGWVIWPVKIVPKMTYKLSSWTLKLYYYDECE